MALSLLGVLCFIEHQFSNRRYLLLISGIIVGLASLYRWDITLYAGISIISTLIIKKLLIVAYRKEFPNGISSGSEVLLFLPGVLSISLVGYGYVASISGWDNLWEQVAVFPTMKLGQVRWVPYPSLLLPFSLLDSNSQSFQSFYYIITKWLRFYFPLLIYALAIFYLLNIFITKREIVWSKYAGIVAVTVFGLLLFVQALSRYSYSHVIPTTIIILLVVASLFNMISKNTGRILGLASLSLLIILIVLYILFPVFYLFRFLVNYSLLKCYSQLERASCVYIDEDQEQAVKYINLFVPHSEKIYVGNRRHDLILANDISFYFLSAHQSVTRYSELYPGVATTLDVQQSIVHDIEVNNTKWIVLVDYILSDEPNASSISSGVRYLDDFLQSNFKPVEKFGDYQILQRIQSDDFP